MSAQAIAARLTAIAERLKAATQGEWYVEHPQVYYKIRVAETQAYILEQNYGGIRDEADADLIANAPADLRFLSAHVETLTQQVAELWLMVAERDLKIVSQEQENARLTAELEKRNAS